MRDRFHISGLALKPLLLIAGILIECLLCSACQAFPSIYLSPILWMLGGLMVTYGASDLFYKQQSTESQPKQFNTFRSNAPILLLYLLLTSILAIMIYPLLKQSPPNPMQSDVIPTIQILVQRVLTGQWVYAPIEFPGWTVNNAYLPLQYLPFVISEVLHLDYRWLAYFIFLLGIGVWLIRMTQQQSGIQIYAKLLFAFACLAMLIRFNKSSLIYSLELIDVAFYFLLALSFFIKDWRFKTFAILCCLLSRYAFILWLPFYAVSFFLEKGSRQMFLISIGVLSGVVLLYVLPFLTIQPTLFFDGLAYYEKTAIGEWTKIPEWYKHVGKPFHLTQGFSMSIFFYDFWDGPIIQRMKAAQLVQLLLSIAAVISISFLYRKMRTKGNLNYAGFCLLSLKFYFIFFYGFFYVPFSYLYWLPVLFSLTILFEYNFLKTNKTNQ